MDAATFKFFEIVLVFGGLLVFGIWQWVSVSREIAKDKEKAQQDPSRLSDSSTPPNQE